MNSLRGRPAGGSNARDRILSAARTQFTEHGYAAASVRAIAREAGVDHALVNYHFGSKAELFGTVMALGVTPSTLLGTVLSTQPGLPPARLAERLVGSVIAVWEDPQLRDPFVVMVRQSLQDEAVRTIVAEFISREVVAQLAAHIGGPEATRRAAGVGTVIIGMIFSRYLLQLEPLASMSPADLVRTLAPMAAVHLR